MAIVLVYQSIKEAINKLTILMELFSVHGRLAMAVLIFYADIAETKGTVSLIWARGPETA